MDNRQKLLEKFQTDPIIKGLQKLLFEIYSNAIPKYRLYDDKSLEKLYDKETLKVADRINDFLNEHIKINYRDKLKQ